MLALFERNPKNYERTAMAQQRTLMLRAPDRARRLQAMVAAFGRARVPAEIGQVAVQQSFAVLGAYAGAVILRTDAHEYRLLAEAGYDSCCGNQVRVPFDAPWPIVDAAQTGTPVWLASRDAYVRRYPRLATQSNGQTMALAAFPLMVDDRSIGALCLSFASAQRFNAGQRATIDTLAQLCAQSLERARLYEAEQQQRLAAAEAVQARDDFLSLAAHELKTPLTSLYGYAQLLRGSAEHNDAFGERDQRAIKVIVNQVERLNLLVDALLDVSRIENGRLGLASTSLDVSVIAREAVDELQPTLARHKLRIEEAGSGLFVQGDAVRLMQAFQNLLLNAIKYSPDGGEIVVRASRDKQHARVDVTDNGIGIPAGALPQLFKRFFRARNVDALRISGLGLGLYIVNEIVALHGGTVVVESDEGKGSRFSVLLPLVDGNQQ